MGFLPSLFKKNWAAEFERAEALFADGHLVRALELASKIARAGDDSVRDSAGALAHRVEAGLLEAALAAAARAEAKGDLEDAADWMLAAIDRTRDNVQATQLEIRRRDLLERSEDNQSPFASAPEAGVDPAIEISLEDRYDTLVSMLEEEIGPCYADRTPRFQAAYVALNEGHAEAAFEPLDDLATASPDDPVLALERGRAHLLLGNPSAARTDLELAWETFGDQPLDLQDSLSVPALWAEAALAVGDDFGAVVERLHPLARVEAGRLEICHLYAIALVTVAAPDEIEAYLNAAMQGFPGEPRFPLLLARQLAATGELDEAIACLEFSVAPSCAGGSCSRPPKDIPSLRALAGLYLARGEASDRAAELMAHIAHAQRGLFGAEDHLLLARFYELRGDPEASEHAKLEAERLAGAGDHQASPAPPRISVRPQRPL